MDNTTVLKYFSGDIHKALSALDGNIREIRMRAESPLAVTLPDRYVYVRPDGMITLSGANAVRVTSEDIKRTFEAICRYSVHSCQDKINKGFITVAGGHRAGICGTAVYSADNKIVNIKHICAINFRIAGEVFGAADDIMNRCMNNSLHSILIFGPPCSGKTTVLRDLCRRVGDKYPVSLMDERGELAAVSGIIPYCHVGENTDIFSGYSKYDGISSAVRSMAPVMIFCDEIGSEEDIKALLLARTSGVKAAATVHCGSPGSLMRSFGGRLFESGLFDYAAFADLKRSVKIYTAKEMMKFTEEDRSHD
ncbi:MAG: hypothetical protein NC120_09115 [Ruminococcus sp.]|nr:hypothetical protein [Ruminococcus sp.]